MSRKILFVLLVSSVVLPLAVLDGVAHPFVTVRELVLRVIVASALSVAILVAAREGIGRPRLLGTAAIACVATALLSVAFSVSPQTSFWGFAERLTGAFTILLVVAYAGMLTLLFRDRRHRRWFLWLWFGVWGVVAIWALLEQMIPGFWSQFNGGGGRSVSTIGNAIFLANSLLATGGTALAVALGSSDRKIRWIGMVFAALCFLGILATETRGAFLGIGVGVLVTAILFASLHKGKAVRGVAIGVSCAIVLGVTGLFLLRNNVAVRALPVVGRAVSAFSSTDISRNQRFDLWRIAADGIRARPLTGWGLENFDTVLDRLYDPSFTRYDITQSYSDRAHNAYLDAAVAGGMPLLAAFLFLFISLGVGIARAYAAGRLNASATAAACGALVAYAAANVTAFETLPTLLCIAVASALLASLAPRDTTPLRFSTWSAIPVGCVSIAIVLLGVIPLLRGAAIVRAAVTASGDLVVMTHAAQEIQTFWNPYRIHQEQRIGNEIFKTIGRADAKTETDKTALIAAEGTLRDAIRVRSENFSLRFTLANVMLLRAMNDTGDFDAALAAFEEARPLAPNRQLVDYQIGNLWLVRKDPERAVAAFERALALATDVPESHWHLARGLAAVGDNAAAAKEFRIAWDSGFSGLRPDDEYAVAINALLAVNDLPLVRDIAAHRAEAEPTNPDRFASLAAVEAALGNREAAAAALREAVRLDPTLRAEAEQFIQQYGLPPETLNP